MSKKKKLLKKSEVHYVSNRIVKNHGICTSNQICDIVTNDKDLCHYFEKDSLELIK